MSNLKSTIHNPLTFEEFIQVVIEVDAPKFPMPGRRFHIEQLLSNGPFAERNIEHWSNKIMPFSKIDMTDYYEGLMLDMILKPESKYIFTEQAQSNHSIDAIRYGRYFEGRFPQDRTEPLVEEETPPTLEDFRQAARDMRRDIVNPSLR